MSEIKGQLLGILLVALIYGAVAVCVTGIFTTLTTEVETQVNDEIAAVKKQEPAHQTQEALQLLTY